MAEDEESYLNMCTLPTEIILSIFNFVPAKDLAKCRQVCQRFKEIVDEMSRNDGFWKRHCQKDFSNIYQTARRKARNGLRWIHIYRSLSLWPKLETAKMIKDEFAPASCVNEEIKNIEILRDGIIGVHKIGTICYYNIETLEPSKRRAIIGDYSKYSENEDSVVILSCQLLLFVIRKTIQTPCFETNVTFEHVKTFILVNRTVYFVNLKDEIHSCNLDDRNLASRFILRTEEGIMCLSYTNNLHVLTFERNIHTLVGDQLVRSCSLNAKSNLMHHLWQFNFLERLDWRVYFQWMYMFNHYVPEGPLRDIVIIRAYGDIYFVGSNWGVLRIYHAPFTSGEFDLFNAEPIKQYNFMERFDCPVLSMMCPIIQVDVMENKDGHTILVAMPKKIAVLNLVHSFVWPAPVAVRPNIDIENEFNINDTGN